MNRRNRKASRKSRMSRRSRKASRKSRRANRRNTRRFFGGFFQTVGSGSMNTGSQSTTMPQINATRPATRSPPPPPPRSRSPPPPPKPTPKPSTGYAQTGKPSASTTSKMVTTSNSNKNPVVSYAPATGKSGSNVQMKLAPVVSMAPPKSAGIAMEKPTAQANDYQKMGTSTGSGSGSGPKATGLSGPQMMDSDSMAKTAQSGPKATSVSSAMEMS